MTSTLPIRALVLGALFAALAGGCEADGQKGLDQSIAAYDAGDFTRAYDLASAASTSARTTHDSDEAAYLAGSSAYRLGNYSDAVRWLEISARSSDKWIAGESGVTLGSALLRLHRSDEAARVFARAAGSLEGESAARAHLASANAYRDVGDERRASEQFALANSGGATGGSDAVASGPPRTPAASSPRVASAPSAGPFAIQAGAFRDESKARRRAAELRSPAQRLGLGSPRVGTKTTSEGLHLWVVQFGSFPDKQSALSALSRLNVSGTSVERSVAGVNAEAG